MFKAQDGFFETAWFHLYVLVQGFCICMCVCMFVDVYACEGGAKALMCQCVWQLRVDTECLPQSFSTQLLSQDISKILQLADFTSIVSQLA